MPKKLCVIGTCNTCLEIYNSSIFYFYYISNNLDLLQAQLIRYRKIFSYFVFMFQISKYLKLRYQFLLVLRRISRITCKLKLIEIIN